VELLVKILIDILLELGKGVVVALLTHKIKELLHYLLAFIKEKSFTFAN